MKSRNTRSVIFMWMLMASCSAVGAMGWRTLDPLRHEATILGWKLIVDAGQGRLVSAVPPGGDNVLLTGGHRVWLGPQTEWPSFWPPPADWEYKPALAFRSPDGTELTLTLPRTEPRYPVLVRRYCLKPGCLEMSVSWQPVEGRPGYQAVQILQTRRETVAFLKPLAISEVPKGFGLLALGARPGNDLNATAPSDVVTIDHSDKWRLSFSGREEKIGVPPQPLEARFIGGHGLRLLPATHDGNVAPGPAPDSGLFTQVYFGDRAWAMVEIEQLSPRLLAKRSDGWVECTVRLEFLTPAKTP